MIIDNRGADLSYDPLAPTQRRYRQCHPGQRVRCAAVGALTGRVPSVECVRTETNFGQQFNRKQPQVKRIKTVLWNVGQRSGLLIVRSLLRDLLPRKSASVYLVSFSKPPTGPREVKLPGERLEKTAK